MPTANNFDSDEKLRVLCLTPTCSDGAESWQTGQTPLIIDMNVRGGLGVVEVEVETLGGEIDGFVGVDRFGG